MRLYDLKIKVIAKDHPRYNQEGYVVTYKFINSDVQFLVRFGNRLEIVFYYQVEIDQKCIEEWDKYHLHEEC